MAMHQLIIVLSKEDARCEPNCSARFRLFMAS
jgi:hypothetical protein